MIKNRGPRLLLAAAVLAALFPAFGAPAEAETRATKRIIVEFGTAPGAQARVRAQDLRTNAGQAGITLRPSRQFSHLVSAVAATVPADQVAKVRALPGVKAVYPDLPMKAATEDNIDLIGAPALWKRKDRAGHDVTGSGVTVAIVDTGIDATHPDLAGKVIGGHDFVNNDDDPSDDNAHGTHVAGIVEQVAPGASLAAYKVLNADGAGYESDIIAGLEAAVDPANPHRAQVVNMSLGGPGDGTDPLGQAATRAAESGVTVVAAAGNDGPGASTIGTPAAADGVVAVGASFSGVKVPTAKLAGTGEELQASRADYSANPPAKPVTGPLVDLGAGQAADFDKAGDLTGKIVAFSGTTYAVTMYDILRAREAEKRGAIAAFVYTNGSGGVSFREDGVQAATPKTLDSGDDLRMDRIVVMNVEDTQWADLARRSAQGPVAITISGTDVTDQIASFSSRGPTGRYTLKPDLVAPGVEVRSSVPKSLWRSGEYRMSGTSMASPHVAGAAALLTQLGTSHVAGALIGAAKPLTGSGPTTQGGGRLDVAAAADATVTAQPPSVSFGLADLRGRTTTATATVTLTNQGHATVRSRFGVSAAPGSPGRVRVTPASVAIPAGRSVAVTVTATADRTATDTDVSGWVTVGARLRVPYLLTLRPLQLTTSPDPSDGHSEVFVYAPADLAAPPVVTVAAPDGRRTDVTATFDHGRWYRAPVTGARPGAYTVQARATTTGGHALWGTDTFEVVANTAGDGGWQPIGPNGQSGLIATSPAAPDQIVLAQDTKVGLWRTTDGGRQWRQLDRLPVAGGMGTVLVDPRDPERMWYAVNGRAEAGSPFPIDPTYEGKVLLTTDGGSTWQTLPFPNAHVTALLSDGHTLLAVTPDGVVASDDGGAHWTTHAVALPTGVTGAALFGGDLYVSAPAGVWVVRNATGNDLAPAEQVFARSGWAGPVGVAADADIVVTATVDGVVHGSRDGGRTWSVLYHDGADGYATAVRMVDGTVYVAGTMQDLVGRDHGATWNAQPKPARGPVDVDFGTLGDSTLVSAGGGGLYTTADRGEHYRRIGVQGGSVSALAVGTQHDGTAELLAGTETGLAKTPLPTGSQVDPEWGSNGEEGTIGTTIAQLATSPADPHVVWKVRTDAFVPPGFWLSRSDDGGATWSDVTNQSDTASALMVDPADAREIVVGFTDSGGSGIDITRDGGVTWRRYLLGSRVDVVVGDLTDPGRLWIGTSDGLYRSDDNGGVHFTKVVDGAVSAITIDRRRPQRIVAGGAALRVSTDGGRTFRTADAGPLAMKVSSLLVSPRDPDVLYAGTMTYRASGLLIGGRGVLRSADGGRTWRNVSSGLQNTAVLSLAVAPDGGWLYAGTERGGVHRLRLTDR